jgi:hypothetical protein
LAPSDPGDLQGVAYQRISSLDEALDFFNAGYPMGAAQ